VLEAVMMSARLLGVMSPWMHSLAMFLLGQVRLMVSMVLRNNAKMMTLRSVSSKISSSTPRRGAESNSTLPFSSVYTAPQLICNSLDHTSGGIDCRDGLACGLHQHASLSRL
jgi:hypothetical protein